jgi:phospholipase/carboxylesterase
VPAIATPTLEHVQRQIGEVADAQPRVIVLHGYGATPEGIVGVLDDWAGPGLALAPRGPLTSGPGHSWFALSRDAGGFNQLGPGIVAAADRVASWMRDQGVSEAEPAVVTGFSQGGMLTFALATQHPELVLVAVPMGGMLPLDLVPTGAPPANAPPIVALHGADDGRVPTALARDAVAALEKAGWKASIEEFAGVGHGVSPPMRARLYTLTGQR